MNDIEDESPTHPNKESTSFDIACIYIIFMLIWTVIIIYFNLFKYAASWILLIPFILFTIGFINSDDLDDKVCNDVLQTTFISLGLIISMPLLSHFNAEVKKDDPRDKEMYDFITKVIFLAMVCTLCSYYHFWVGIDNRGTCKIIRSCLEQFAITLYLFAIALYLIKKH